MNASVSATLGVVLLCQGQNEPARLAFNEAIAQADSLLKHTPHNYQALDSKALGLCGLCGLALVGDAARLSEARVAIQAARAINKMPGSSDGWCAC